MEFSEQLIARTKELTALTSQKLTDILCEMEKAGRYGKADIVDKNVCLLQDIRNLLAYIYLKEFEAYRDWIFGTMTLMPCDPITSVITSMDIVVEVPCDEEPLQAIVDMRPAFSNPELVDWQNGQIVETPATSGNNLPTAGGTIHASSGKFQFDMDDPETGSYRFQVLFSDLSGNELDVVSITFNLTCTCDDDETIAETCIDEEIPTITEINIP